MSQDETKRALRKQMLGIRNELAPSARAEADALVTAAVLALPEYATADVLLAYLDFGSEVRTRDIIVQAWAAEKVVALPWCVPGTREMLWYEVESFEGLVKSKLGVEEPDPDICLELDPASATSPLCLVPGLAFDERGYRLGYGGGFYDSFLAGFSGASVGLCREVQMMDDLRAAGVVDAHDLPVQLVVTDERVLRTEEDC